MEEKEEVKNSMPFWKRPTVEIIKSLELPREGVQEGWEGNRQMEHRTFLEQ